MSYKGERLLPLMQTAASQLLENRIVTFTDAGVPSYATYGSVSNLGVTRARGNENDYVISVMPLDFIDTTFFVRLAGTVAAGNPLLCAADGKVVTSKGTAVSRSVNIPGSHTEGTIYIVPGATAGAGWVSDGGAANQTATRGASSYTYATPAAGDAYFVTDEGIYVIFNGTAWVRAKVVALAEDSGVSGEEIACYCPKALSQITREQLAATINGMGTIVAAGLSASETDADATVTVLDERAATGDFVFASVKTAANAVGVIKALVSAADTITITLSGNGGAGTVCSYIVVRLASGTF